MDNILRHYDVTGKDCPRYFVKNETEWETLKTDVFTYIEEIRSEKK
jgi:N-acetylmuramoyl-L-alanine amidase CwlA